MQTKQEIKELAKRANGNRKTRLIADKEIEEIINLIKEHQNNQKTHTIRVYSHSGFVPNSYRYRALISVLEATRDSNNEFIVHCFTVDAKRSRGKGARVTINHRGV